MTELEKESIIAPRLTPGTPGSSMNFLATSRELPVYSHFSLTKISAIFSPSAMSALIEVKADEAGGAGYEGFVGWHKRLVLVISTGISPNCLYCFRFRYLIILRNEEWEEINSISAITTAGTIILPSVVVPSKDLRALLLRRESAVKYQTSE